MKTREHLLLVAETQMGKTTLGLRLIQRRHEFELERYGKSVTQWTIIDPKRTFWLGLESVVDSDGKACVLHPCYSAPESLVQVLEKLRYLVQILEHRQRYRWDCYSRGQEYKPGRPRVLLLEEWIAFGKLAQAYERATGGSKKGSLWGEILELVLLLLLNGLEDNIFVWIFSQSPYLKSNYFDDSSVRDQFAYCCLGSPIKGYGPIEKTLLSPWIVPSASERSRLRSELEEFIRQGLWVCLTTYGGRYTLRQTPQIDPAIKSTRIFFGESLLHSEPVPPQNPTVAPEDNLILFPSPGPALSRPARKLLDYALKQGVQIRLQQAYKALGKYGKAEIVRAAAAECAQAGVAELKENPAYPGSFFFTAFPESTYAAL